MCVDIMGVSVSQYCCFGQLKDQRVTGHHMSRANGLGVCELIYTLYYTTSHGYLLDKYFCESRDQGLVLSD